MVILFRKELKQNENGVNTYKQWSEGDNRGLRQQNGTAPERQSEEGSGGEATKWLQTKAENRYNVCQYKQLDKDIVNKQIMLFIHWLLGR